MPNIIPQFPLRVQLQKIYPHLAGEFGTPILIPFILESVFIIVENCNSEEFVEEIMPSLVLVFPIQTPYQVFKKFFFWKFSEIWEFFLNIF